MKKTVSLILALLMCFTMAVTGMADYSAGTYTGTAAGRNGDITVEVILSDDAIESVTVTAHQETIALFLACEYGGFIKPTVMP